MQTQYDCGWLNSGRGTKVRLRYGLMLLMFCLVFPTYTAGQEADQQQGSPLITYELKLRLALLKAQTDRKSKPDADLRDAAVGLEAAYAAAASNHEETATAVRPALSIAYGAGDSIADIEHAHLLAFIRLQTLQVEQNRRIIDLLEEIKNKLPDAKKP